MLTVTARSSDTTAYAEFSQAVKKVSEEKFNYIYDEEVNCIKYLNKREILLVTSGS